MSEGERESTRESVCVRMSEGERERVKARERERARKKQRGTEWGSDRVRVK